MPPATLCVLVPVGQIRSQRRVGDAIGVCASRRCSPGTGSTQIAYAWATAWRPSVPGDLHVDAAEIGGDVDRVEDVGRLARAPPAGADDLLAGRARRDRGDERATRRGCRVGEHHLPAGHTRGTDRPRPHAPHGRRPPRTLVRVRPQGVRHAHGRRVDGVEVDAVSTAEHVRAAADNLRPGWTDRTDGVAEVRRDGTGDRHRGEARNRPCGSRDDHRTTTPDRDRDQQHPAEFRCPPHGDHLQGHQGRVRARISPAPRPRSDMRPVTSWTGRLSGAYRRYTRE